MLLHGGNGAAPLARLEPRQASDAWKASGNLRAVYASDEVLLALMQALLDRDFLRSVLGSFHHGYRLIDGVPLLMVDANVHALFLAGETRLCSDGFVYVLAKRDFTQAADSAAEWHRSAPAIPWCVAKVPARLGALLFRVGRPGGANSVLPYSDDEMRRIAAAIPA